MRKLTINCEGKTLDDIEKAIIEATRVFLNTGCSSAMDSNDSGSYDYVMVGTDEEEPKTKTR